MDGFEFLKGDRLTAMQCLNDVHEDREVYRVDGFTRHTIIDNYANEDEDRERP